MGEGQRVRKAQRYGAVAGIRQQVFVRQDAFGVAQEVQETDFIDPWSVNPFETTFSIEDKTALDPYRARAEADEAAILVDVPNQILRKDPEQRDWRLVLCHAHEAKKGLVGAVARYTVIGDTAAEFARKLFDPAVDERDVVTPDEGVAVGRSAGVPRFWEIRIVLGAGPVARWRDSITW